MWAYPVWFLLVSACSPDGACVHEYIQGFVNRDMCQLASRGPLPGLLRHVAPGDGEGWRIVFSCIPVPLREA